MYMPYIKYQHTAASLSDDHLDNTIKTCIQIFRVFLGENRVLRGHPIYRMWKGHEMALLTFGGSLSSEWSRRMEAMLGEADPERQIAFHSLAVQHGSKFSRRSVLKPSWLGDIDYHRSCRSELLRLDREHYGPQGWGEVPERMPQLFPRSDTNGKDYSLYLNNFGRAAVASGEMILPEWLKMEADGEVINVEDDGQEASEA